MSSLLDDLLILPTPILLLLTPLNLALLLCLSVLVYNLLPALPATTALPTQPTAYNWRPAAYTPTLLWRDYTPRELAAFNGIKSDSNPQSRILFAIRRKVYDVTAGKNFYGPGGPYESFAGRDASRGLAKQSFDDDMLTSLDEPIDSLADLEKSEWANLKDWESTFEGKYILCGDLIDAP